MPTNKHRYMIVLDDSTYYVLIGIMNRLKTKQKSKAITYLIRHAYQIKVD